MWRRRLLLASMVAAVCIAGSLSPAGAAPDAIVATPGDRVTLAGGGGPCTLGFLFTGSDRASYMSTAGHCLLGTAEARTTWALGKGPAVTTPAGRIGELIFAERLPAGDEDADVYDFALIRLDKGVRASAALPTFGAPTGSNDSQTDEPTILHIYGQGTGVSAASPARDFLATTLKRTDHVYAHGVAAPGDSGAPVIDADGKAIGTFLGVGGMPIRAGLGGPTVGHDGAFNRIGRLKPVLAHASSALRLRLGLVTSSA
jgi:hypothetical protein